MLRELPTLIRDDIDDIDRAPEACHHTHDDALGGMGRKMAHVVFSGHRRMKSTGPLPR